MATTSGKGQSASGDRRRGAKPSPKAGGKGSTQGASKGASRGTAKGGAPSGTKGGAKQGPPREEQDTAAQLAAPLRRVLARLPETQRRVLELRMGLTDGHPHDAADAARVLGISLGELREIEARAFERIREVIPLQQLQRFLDR
jgi:DNA-directed RNA polymerase specialized sigma24 family protein